MDADDVSCPSRLAEQIALLDENPDVGIVASACDLIDASGRRIRSPELWRLSSRAAVVPFAHGAMMYRREVFDAVGGYRPESEYWEDYDLVMRMARFTKVLIIPRALYRVRQARTSTRLTCHHERLERALDLHFEASDLLNAGRDYAMLFERPRAETGKLDPRAFIASGALRLWAGSKPRLFRRLLRRARLSWNMRSAAAIVWTAWASLSPSSLRLFLLFLLKARNRLTSARHPTSVPIAWAPPNIQQAEPRPRDANQASQAQVRTSAVT